MKKLLFLLLLISQTAAAQVGYGFIDQSSAVTYATWNPADKSANITLSISTPKQKAHLLPVITRYAAPSAKTAVSIIEITLTKYKHDPNLLLAAFRKGRIGKQLHRFYSRGVHNYQRPILCKRRQLFARLGSVDRWRCGGLALDLTGGTESLKIYRNNTLLGSITTSAGTYFAGTGTYQTLGYSIANFGATAMAYTAPAGYNQGLYQ